MFLSLLAVLLMNEPGDIGSKMSFFIDSFSNSRFASPFVHGAGVPVMKCQYELTNCNIIVTSNGIYEPKSVLAGPTRNSDIK
jgi:hypothetical protein